jgi:PAS domain S-box-containing protein
MHYSPDAIPESVLRVSEARYRRLFESAQDGILLLNAESAQIEDVNPYLIEMLGYSHAEFLGKKLWEVGSFADRAESSEMFTELQTAGYVRYEHLPLRTKTGALIDVEFVCNSYDCEGVKVIQCNIRDITARKQLEARVRAVVEAAPSAIVMTGPSGLIEMVNAQTERAFGYNRSELLGQPIETLIPDRFKAHHPILRDSFFGNPASRTMGAGRDLYGLKKDGSEFPIEISLSLIPTDDSTMVLSAITDITERKRFEEALQQSIERFQSIFDAITEGIFLLDISTGTFTEVNKAGAAMGGYTVDESVGLSIQEISSGVSPYTLSGAMDWIEKAVKTGRAQLFDWHFKAKDGRLFWTEILLRSASIGGKQLVLAIIRDVSERRAIEQKLRQSQKMEAIGQLTGGIAHDFNNLLAVIQGNLEMISAEVAGKSDFAEMTDDALRAVGRGASLTRQLLAFSRLQPLVPQVVRLDALIASITKLLQRTLGETIEIKTNIPPSLWAVQVDPNQLENALLNLAVNARDAMPDGGKLTLEASNKILDRNDAERNAEVSPGCYVQLAVTDTGIGMPKEMVEKAIEPFFTTKPMGKGTGLGLSMVYGFLKQSGGHLNIYSELGRGTTVRLYLPRANQGSVDVGAANHVSEVPRCIDGEVILILEDDEGVRKFAVRALTGLGYRIFQAGDGPDALRVLSETGRIDMLLSDVTLPNGMSGPAVVREAKILRPGLKVLFMSGA